MHHIAILPGDGIGPEVIRQALCVLDAAAQRFNFAYKTHFAPIGGEAIDKTGKPLPDETLRLCQDADAVLLGAVGGPAWDHLPADKRPERGILALRSALKLFANLRPITVYDALKDASPLKSALLNGGCDILFVRELTGGIYFGPRGRQMKNGVEAAYDTEIYSVDEIKRIAHIAFEMARKRTRRLTSVDKANVLNSSRLWREVIDEMAFSYPDITVEHLYVDNAAMQLICRPTSFDVILTNNIFGDILSDEASQITGSIGLLPSASLGADRKGLYEPIHGSSPDLAGKDLANPIAAILSAAMMLRYSFDESQAAGAIECAVDAVLKHGVRTADIAGSNPTVGTARMGHLIASELLKQQ